MTNLIKINDIKEIEQEHRIQDIVLGRALGLVRSRKIKEVIESNMAELLNYGRTPLLRADVKIGCATRKTESYYLNEPQALLICMFSRTERAAQVRKEVIDAYMSFKAQNNTPTVPVNAHTRRLPSGKKEIVLSDTEHKTIGGMIKKCCAVAVRSELNNVKVVEPNFTYLFPAWLCRNEFEPNLVQSELESMINFLHEKLKGQKERDTSLYGLYRFFIAVNGLFVRYGSVRSETLFVSEMMSKNNGYNKEHLSEAIRRINEFASSAPVGYSKSYF